MSYKKIITDFKDSGKGLMNLEQYMALAEDLDSLAPCNFLVFGLGEDSFVWQKINAGGKTVFIEDDKDWADKFKNSDLEIHMVKYSTNVSNYAKLVDNNKSLELKIPEEIREISWDIILVDAPLGHGPSDPYGVYANTPGRPFKGPGRMSSIYEASRLIKPGGIVVVDDMGRLVESLYAQKYLGKNNMYRLINGKVGFFRTIL